MNRKGYEINYITNTITVSKKFLEQASTLGGDTYDTMKALRELGMPIILEKMKKRKASSRLTYKQMLHHISCLADAKHYLAEFEAVRKAWTWLIHQCECHTLPQCSQSHPPAWQGSDNMQVRCPDT